MATRERLAETARVNERLRIARELHDAMGHHLAGLSLNLEVLGQRQGASPPLETARSLTRRLLDDLESLVDALGRERDLDLASALDSLSRDIPRPRVHVSAGGVTIPDPERAHALWRCCQEIVTNAVKHSEAENLWIAIRAVDGWVELTARDDGAGSVVPGQGQGLEGMRQRVSDMGGTFHLETGRGAGFEVHLTVPTGCRDPRPDRGRRDARARGHPPAPRAGPRRRRRGRGDGRRRGRGAAPRERRGRRPAGRADAATRRPRGAAGAGRPARRSACLLLTTFDDREALLGGLRAGARGYLRKDVTVETLVRAIHALADGGTFFQPSLTEKLLRGVKRSPASGVPPAPVLIEPLTPRETEVMRMVAGGYSNREIGAALGTAEGTVKVQVSSILSKLGVRDRVQAVLRVLEAGLV